MTGNDSGVTSGYCHKGGFTFFFDMFRLRLFVLLLVPYACCFDLTTSFD